MRALFGGIVEKTEDPERILQQTIRDMRDRVPELNNSVAQVMATEKLLAKNKERLETQVVELDSKIKASVKMGRDDIATAYIGQLQQAQLDLERTDAQLDHAGLASKQALKARDNYVLNMALDSRGNIWFSTMTGIARYDGKRMDKWTGAQVTNLQSIGAIYAAPAPDGKVITRSVQASTVDDELNKLFKTDEKKDK